MRRAAVAVVAVVVAGVVGSAVALVASRLIEFQTFGFWGAVYGALAFLAALGITLAGLGGGVQRRLGRLVLALSAGLLSAGTWFYISWGISPLTVEGAWMWPLAVGSAILAVVAMVSALRPER